MRRHRSVFSKKYGYIHVQWRRINRLRVTLGSFGYSLGGFGFSISGKKFVATVSPSCLALRSIIWLGNGAVDPDLPKTTARARGYQTARTITSCMFTMQTQLQLNIQFAMPKKLGFWFRFELTCKTIVRSRLAFTFRPRCRSRILEFRRDELQDDFEEIRVTKKVVDLRLFILPT